MTRITSVQAIVPLAITSIVHIMTPILLNPYITSEKLRDHDNLPDKINNNT